MRAQVSHGHVPEPTFSHAKLETFLQQFLRYMLRRWTERLLTISTNPCALLEALLALLGIFSFIELMTTSQNSRTFLQLRWPPSRLNHSTWLTISVRSVSFWVCASCCVLPHCQIRSSTCIHRPLKLLTFSCIHVGFASLLITGLPHVCSVVLQERWHRHLTYWVGRLLAPLSLLVWLSGSKLGLGDGVLLVLESGFRSLILHQAAKTLTVVATVRNPILPKEVLGFRSTLLVDGNPIQTWSSSSIDFVCCNSIELVLQKWPTSVAIEGS